MTNRENALSTHAKPDDKERIEAFLAHPDGGSRRTWFNIKKKLALNTRLKPSV